MSIKKSTKTTVQRGAGPFRKVISQLRELTTTFYFVPTLFILGAVLLAEVTLWIDRHVLLSDDPGRFLQWIGEIGVDGSRSMLSAIGTAMLGVAATMFSITISVIATASSTYGPRLVRNFMSDRGNQVVLGGLSANFIYALLILRTIRASSDDRLAFVPQTSVRVAIFFALLNVAMVIWFIHHIADSVQVSTLAEEVRKQWVDAVHRAFPKLAQDSTPDVDEDGNGTAKRTEFPEPGRNSAARVTLGKIGYITEVGLETLSELAEREDVQIALIKRVGDHIATDEPAFLVWPAQKAEAVTEAARKSFRVDDSRTTFQDLRFAEQQVVELAVRALSPGTNDPYTAVNAIHELGSGITEAVARKEQGDVLLRAGQPRLWCHRESLRNIVETPFDQIRPFSIDSLITQQALIDLGRRIQAASAHAEIFDLVEEKLDQLQFEVEEGQTNPYDIAAFKRYRDESRIDGIESWRRPGEGETRNVEVG